MLLAFPYAWIAVLMQPILSRRTADSSPLQCVACTAERQWHGSKSELSMVMLGCIFITQRIKCTTYGYVYAARLMAMMTINVRSLLTYQPHRTAPHRTAHTAIVLHSYNDYCCCLFNCFSLFSLACVFFR